MSARRQPNRLEMGKQRVWCGAVESLSEDGQGVATLTAEGHKRPLFIPYTVPGDVVEASIVAQRGKYSFGQLEKVVTPSKARITPICPHFGICGGCNLEHIAYEEQLVQKAKIVEFLLKKHGVTLPRMVTVAPSKLRHHYRRRARVAIAISKSGIVVGFRKGRSREIVPVTKCFIVEEQIVALITLLNRQKITIKETIGFEIEAAVSSTGKVSVRVPLRDLPAEERSIVRTLFERIYGERRELLGNLFFDEEGGLKTVGQVQEHLTYTAAGCVFAFLPGTFIQSNSNTNELLIATVLDFLTRPVPKESVKRRDDEMTVLDLYAGLGNLSIPIAQRSAFVIAVEGNRESVRLGRINATQNGVKNCKFFHEQVEAYLKELETVKADTKDKNNGTNVTEKKDNKKRNEERFPRADRIVLDPPRIGCAPEVLEALTYSGASRIVYISCNPATLARDLASLQRIYRVADIACLDMFPDISQVETVVLLEKK